MSVPPIESSKIIDAPPAAVYDLVSDYTKGHSRILPKPYFASLDVEKGGKGAGTVIRVAMDVLGTNVNYRMHVTEPDPGRILREEDPDAGVATTFTFTPVDGGRRTLVTISTAWRPRPGLVGLVERLINPVITRRIYRQELDLLSTQLQGVH